MSQTAFIADELSKSSFSQICTGYPNFSSDFVETQVSLEAIRNSEVRFKLCNDLILKAADAALRSTKIDGKVIVAHPFGQRASVIVNFPLRLQDNLASKEIKEVAESLKLPLTIVLKAANISHRTFYSWRHTPGSTPRVRNLVRLWNLVQFRDRLIRITDPRIFIRIDNHLNLFLNGEFERLLVIAAESVMPPKSSDSDGSYLSSTEDEVEEFEPSQRTVVLRGSRRVRPGLQA